MADSKSYYPPEETASWIEEIADESDRSESYVVVELVDAVRTGLGGSHDNIDQLLDDLESRLE